jgi:BTB/POZ domain
MESQEAELSFKEVVGAAMTDDKFHDITLQGNDGVQVPANRTILGLRSPVFQKMLFGNFQEATKKIVSVDYPGTVVKAIVEYIYTNQAEKLVKLVEAKIKDKEIPAACQEEFQTLLTLAAAAAYYILPKLCHEVNGHLSTYLVAYPLLAFPVLDAYSQKGVAISDNLKTSALSKIEKLLLGKYFDVKILANFSNGAVGTILVDGKTFLSEKHRFLLIDHWHRAGSTDQDRGCIAKQLVKDHLDLQLIDPEYLSTTVTLSGLVTSEQLIEAYKSQAIGAKKKFKISFTKTLTYSNPIWSHSNSATFASKKPANWQSDTLKCHILLPGSKYTWTVTINGNPFVWLGVVVSTESPKFNGKDFIKRKGARYGLYGHSDHYGEAFKFKKGDHVNMALDLAPEEEVNGTLSVSVNNQPAVVIYTDMLAKLTRGTNEGFVPAVACFVAKVTIESIGVIEA